MQIGSYEFDDDDDDGLPDAAFTQGELDAGVQHIMRSKRADAFQIRRSTHNLDEDRRESLSTQLPSDTLKFATFAHAQAWAKANPGCVFSRATDGEGFVGKYKAEIVTAHRINSASSVQDSRSDWKRNLDDQRQLEIELKQLLPYISNALHCWGNSNSVRFKQPFTDSAFIAEIGKISKGELKRVRDILVIELQNNLKELRTIESHIRNDRRMKAGNYGEFSFRAVNVRIQRALDLIDDYIEI